MHTGRKLISPRSLIGECFHTDVNLDSLQALRFNRSQLGLGFEHKLIELESSRKRDRVLHGIERRVELSEPTKSLC